MTQLVGFSKQDHPHDGCGVQDVQGGHVLQDVTPGGGEEEQFCDAKVYSSFADEDRFGETADEFQAGSFMMQKTRSTEDESDDGEEKFIEVANISENRERAETLTTVQREHIHEALAVQEGRDAMLLQPVKTKVLGLPMFQMLEDRQNQRSLLMMNV